MQQRKVEEKKNGTRGDEEGKVKKTRTESKLLAFCFARRLFFVPRHYSAEPFKDINKKLLRRKAGDEKKEERHGSLKFEPEKSEEDKHEVEAVLDRLLRSSSHCSTASFRIEF
jgi:hypothetical protein